MARDVIRQSKVEAEIRRSMYLHACLATCRTRVSDTAYTGRARLPVAVVSVDLYACFIQGIGLDRTADV